MNQKLRKSRPGRGIPHRTLEPNMDQISILGALVALGLSCGVLGASWGRFGTVWSGSWVPTWVPTWSQLGQKIDPKIDHFWDASWDLFLDGFLWILGAQMEPSWHPNGIKNRCLLGRAIFQNSCSGCSAGGPQRIPHRTVRWGTTLALDGKKWRPSWDASW